MRSLDKEKKIEEILEEKKTYLQKKLPDALLSLLGISSEEESIEEHPISNININLKKINSIKCDDNNLRSFIENYKDLYVTDTNYIQEHNETDAYNTFETTSLVDTVKQFENSNISKIAVDRINTKNKFYTIFKICSIISLIALTFVLPHLDKNLLRAGGSLLAAINYIIPEKFEEQKSITNEHEQVESDGNLEISGGVVYANFTEILEQNQENESQSKNFVIRLGNLITYLGEVDFSLELYYSYLIILLKTKPLLFSSSVTKSYFELAVNKLVYTIQIIRVELGYSKNGIGLLKSVTDLELGKLFISFTTGLFKANTANHNRQMACSFNLFNILDNIESKKIKINDYINTLNSYITRLFIISNDDCYNDDSYHPDIYDFLVENDLWSGKCAQLFNFNNSAISSEVPSTKNYFSKNRFLPLKITIYQALKDLNGKQSLEGFLTIIGEDLGKDYFDVSNFLSTAIISNDAVKLFNRVTLLKLENSENRTAIIKQWTDFCDVHNETKNLKQTREGLNKIMVKGSRERTFGRALEDLGYMAKGGGLDYLGLAGQEQSRWDREMKSKAEMSEKDKQDREKYDDIVKTQRLLLSKWYIENQESLKIKKINRWNCCSNTHILGIFTSHREGRELEYFTFKDDVINMNRNIFNNYIIDIESKRCQFIFNKLQESIIKVKCYIEILYNYEIDGEKWCVVCYKSRYIDNKDLYLYFCILETDFFTAGNFGGPTWERITKSLSIYNNELESSDGVISKKTFMIAEQYDNEKITTDSDYLKSRIEFLPVKIINKYSDEFKIKIDTDKLHFNTLKSKNFYINISNLDDYRELSDDEIANTNNLLESTFTNLTINDKIKFIIKILYYLLDKSAYFEQIDLLSYEELLSKYVSMLCYEQVKDSKIKKHISETYGNCNDCSNSKLDRIMNESSVDKVSSFLLKPNIENICKDTKKKEQEYGVNIHESGVDTFYIDNKKNPISPKTVVVKSKGAELIEKMRKALSCLGDRCVEMSGSLSDLITESSTTKSLNNYIESKEDKWITNLLIKKKKTTHMVSSIPVNNWKRMGHQVITQGIDRGPQISSMSRRSKRGSLPNRLEGRRLSRRSDGRPRSRRSDSSRFSGGSLKNNSIYKNKKRRSKKRGRLNRRSRKL